MVSNSGRRILVMDDEPVMRETLRRYLARQGFEVTLASYGRDGIEKYKLDRHDFVITDMHMPGLNIFEIIQELRKINGDVKIMVLSGNATPETSKQALEAGATRFMAKPFSLVKLLKIMRRLTPFD